MSMLTGQMPVNITMDSMALSYQTRNIRVKHVSANNTTDHMYRPMNNRVGKIVANNTSNQCGTSNINPYWQQYLQHKRSPHSNRNGLQNYTYKFSVDSKASNMDYLYINTLEQEDNKPSSGGSSFRVLLEYSRLITLCDVTDYFNGHYIIKCHLSGSLCYNITVILSYTNFGAFKSFGNVIPSFRKTLWNYTYCTEATKQNVFSTHPNCSLHPDGKVAWYKDEGRNMNIVIDNCKVNVPHTAVFKSCIKKLGSLTFIGDSHTRYNYYYLLYELGIMDRALTKQFGGNYKKDNIYYKGVRYTESAAEKIHAVARQFQDAPGVHVIIANGGIWDLRDRGPINFMQGFANVKAAVRDVLNNSKNNMRFIWYSSLAFPEDIGPDGRTNPGVAAINQWVKCELVPLGVEMFDISFMASYIRNEEGVCNHHYLCISDDMPQVVYGDVGGEIMNTLMSYICESY